MFNVPTTGLDHLDVLAELLNAGSKTAMITAWALPSVGLVCNLRQWPRTRAVGL